MVVDVAVAHSLVLVDEVADRDVALVVLNDADCGYDARNEYEKQQYAYGPAATALQARVGETYHRETQQFDDKEAGETDEDAVDAEEVEGAEGVVPVQGGDAEADRTERRHERGGDGNSGEHGTLLLSGGLEHSGRTAEEGDEYVIDRRVGPGQELGRVLQVERGEDEVEGRCHNGYSHHQAQVLERTDDELHVIGPEAEGRTEDRSHKRGDKHGADDHRDRVDVQSDRGYDYGERKDVNVRATEQYAPPDVLVSHREVHVVREVQNALEVVRDGTQFFIIHSVTKKLSP